MPARTQLNRLQCTPRVEMIDVPVLSPDRCGSFEQWATQPMSNNSADVFTPTQRRTKDIATVHCYNSFLQWRLHNMFLNWNGRGNVSAHERTEVTSNRTLKPTEIEPRARPCFWHVALFACFVSDSGLQISSKHSSTHRRGWITTAVHNETLFSPELRVYMTSNMAPMFPLVRSLTVGSRYTRMDLFLIRHVWQFVQQASTKWKRKRWMASNPGLPRTQTFNQAQIMQLHLSRRGLRRRLTDYADLLTWSCVLTLWYVPRQEKIKGPDRRSNELSLFIVCWVWKGKCTGEENFNRTQNSLWTVTRNVPETGWYRHENCLFYNHAWSCIKPQELLWTPLIFYTILIFILN